MATYKDRIGEIPEDWEAVNGYNYLLLESGMRPAEHVTDNPNDIPSLGGENITSDGFLTFKNLRYISREYFARMPKGKLVDEDILINKDGANTGKLAFAKTNPFPETSVNEHVFLIRNKGDFEQEFLFYFLLSALGQNQIQPKVVGSAQPGINNSFTKGLYIPKPPKPEQRTIASILSKVDEAIAATKNSIAKAERLKKALMQNLLTGKLKPDGTWRKEDEFQETIYGMVAKEWRYCKIQELIKDGIITGVQDGNHGESHPVSAEFVKEGIPFIMASDISKGFVDFTTCKNITFERAEKLRIGFSIKDDVLLSHKASMGFTAIVPDVDPYIMLTPQVTYYRCNKEKLLPEFLHFFFQSYKFQKLFETYSAQTTRNFMGITNQKKLYIFLPNTVEEQELIIKPIKEVDKTLVSKYDKIKKLERLKKALMQNLLTGKVRVKVPKEELQTETK